MRRIAIVCEYATLNGGERSMLAAVSAMPAGAFEFVFLAPTEGRLADELRRLGIVHVPLDLRDTGDNRLPRDEACARIVDAVRDIQPDLVHANSLSMGRLTGAIANQLDVPCVAHLRDIVGLSRAAVDDLNRNRLIIAVSRATRDFHVQQGLNGNRVRVVYNGVDCQQFQPRPRTGSLHAELGLPTNAFLIATIGQIGLRKGQDVLTKAAGLLATKLPDAYYLLVGERNSRKQESVEFEESIVAQFSAAGMSDRLHRLGYRNDVAQILNEIDLLVHPAQQEPLGRVLLEAAASGVPIVATDVGGTREILEDGVSASLVPVNDPVALAGAIAELDADIEKRRGLAEAARVHIQMQFEINAASSHLSIRWKRLLASTTARGRGGLPPSDLDKS